jgi:hypothetical protein
MNQVQGPPFEDVIKLGSFYGFTPNELAEVSGLWTDRLSRPSHPELRRLGDLVAELPPERQDELLSMLAIFAETRRRCGRTKTVLPARLETVTLSRVASHGPFTRMKAPKPVPKIRAWGAACRGSRAGL